MSNQKGPKYSTPLVGMRGRCHRIMLLPREIVPNLVVLGQTVLAYIEGLQIWKHSRRVGLEVIADSLESSSSTWAEDELSFPYV